ncbi:MAG: hypothetical protein AUJ57_01885 [Zetaproteobacteria bacterium CG1_02_53_45]|nr:MAG: hypothetical protein AUJ57_01885 [Zetaproteobacteria bacterium CG1_02_53_45]
MAWLLLMLLTLSGCLIITKDSPAPGCIKTIGLLPMVSGCFGKTVLSDVKVEPQQACLTITVNNCNGGVLAIHNNCSESFNLAGVSVLAGTHMTMDLVNSGSEFRLVETDSNFSAYTPAADERVQLVGTLGSGDVSVSFIKTGKLCE